MYASRTHRRLHLRRLLLLLVLFLLLPTSALWWGGMAGAQQPAPPQLRVLTYNIHHGEAMDGSFDYERLARVITDVNPDVVALQEVDRGTRRASGADQPAVLEELTGMQAVFGHALIYEGGEYGEALLSRWPLESRGRSLESRGGRHRRRGRCLGPSPRACRS